MTKYLRVDIDRGLAGQDMTEYIELPGHETEEEKEELARDVFQDHCSYGWSVVDESEVSDDWK